MERLILVLNPKSSKAKLIDDEVLKPVRKFKGFLIGKFEVKPTNVDENAEKMAEILQDGDLVVACGGDATASVGLNGCLLSGKDVVFSALSFGNFSDTARTLGDLTIFEVIDRFSKKKFCDFYPVDCLVDGEHFRYAAGYLTIGMMAESVELFNREKNRNKMKNKKRNEVSSYWWLFKWYLRNRKRKFIDKETTDYFVVNGSSIARIMKGKNYYSSKEFLCNKFRLSRLFLMIKFMMRAIFRGIDGEVKKTDILEFWEEKKITVQMEGESREFLCKKIEIKKEKKLKVIAR